MKEISCLHRIPTSPKWIRKSIRLRTDFEPNPISILITSYDDSNQCLTDIPVWESCWYHVSIYHSRSLNEEGHFVSYLENKSTQLPTSARGDKESSCQLLLLTPSSGMRWLTVRICHCLFSVPHLNQQSTSSGWWRVIGRFFFVWKCLPMSVR